MRNLKFTLKAWPVIAIATIGLCFLTELVAGWFGVKLTEQNNIELVRRAIGWNLTFALLVVQIVLLMPAIEEVIFRWLLFKLPAKWLNNLTMAIISSAVFSFAHYPDYMNVAPGPFRPLDNAFFALFFFGLAQTYLYHKTNRLWCTILNHALFNTTNLILLFIIPAQP